MEVLENGESWVLKPEFTDNNKYMLRPAIKWGVTNDNFCHMTELFGPLLSVMRADNLKHAIELVNKTGYGLTSGIESLDEREIDEWRENIKAGNLYINRGTTGAIVLRQPFGGIGKSAIGSGRKVGIYNYLTQFMNVEDVTPPKILKNKKSRYFKLLEDWEHKHEVFKNDISQLKEALKSYLHHYKYEFSQEHDYFKLRGEDNIFRYIKLRVVALRVSENDSFFECLSRIFAAKVSGTAIRVSVDDKMNNDVSKFLFTYANKIFQSEDMIKKESEPSFARCFPSVDRIIYSKESEISKFIFAEAARLTKFIVRTPPIMEGCLELLNYFNEQSISHSYHRYGNLGERAND